MLSLFLSLSAAWLLYELYWQVLGRLHGVHARWIGRSIGEQRLREGGAGYLRLLIVWILMLSVYSFGVERAVLSNSFANAFVSWDEWLFIIITAPLMALAEWHFTSSRTPTVHEA